MQEIDFCKGFGSHLKLHGLHSEGYIVVGVLCCCIFLERMGGEWRGEKMESTCGRNVQRSRDSCSTALLESYLFARVLNDPPDVSSKQQGMLNFIF